MADEEPKIFVDEGWKAQVERERQEAAAKSAQPQDAQQAGSVAGLQPDEEGAQPDYLEPSFHGIVTNLATQAMMALGGMPGPNEDEVVIDLHQARFCIEGLAILKEKTSGNLTEDETKHLDEVYRQLAQAFGMILQEYQAQAMREAGVDPNQLRP